MIIRRIEIKDLNFVFELLNKLYEYKMNLNTFLKLYKERINDDKIYDIVAMENNKIIGVLISEINWQFHRNKNLVL